MEEKKVYICELCGFCYDESEQAVPFDELPDDYQCPICNAGKDKFHPIPA